MSELHAADLETRLRRIEEVGLRADTRLEAVLPHLATKAELAELRADLAKTEARLIRWLIGVGAGAVIVLSGQLWGAAQLVLHGLK